MIKNETEYRLTKRRIEQSKDVALRMREQLIAEGLTAEQIERVMEPTLTFQQGYVEEARWYERVRAGDIMPIQSLGHIGQVLIGLRIAHAMTQKELAERLSVSEGVVSRDERNDYHGISVERAQRILDALEGHITLVVTPTTKGAGPVRELAPV